jgi:hypothetical protein
MTPMDRTNNIIACFIAGTAMGIVFGLICFWVGLFFTATIIGAIIGVPLMIVGVFVFFAGPVIGIVAGVRMKQPLKNYKKGGVQ